MSRNFELLQAVEQAQDFFTPVIASPDAASVVVKTNIESDVWQRIADSEILKLVQRLFFSGSNGTAVKRVLFCSVNRTESSQLVAIVSRTLAQQTTSHVCIIDASCSGSDIDGRTRMNLPSAPVHGATPASEGAPQQLATNLWFFSAKALSNGNGLAGADAVRAKIARLRADFEYVLIDAPPLGIYNDAIVLGQEVDGVVLVIEANSTRRAAASRAKQALDAASVRLLGTVLNNRTFPIPEKLYRNL